MTIIYGTLTALNAPDFCMRRTNILQKRDCGFILRVRSINHKKDHLLVPDLDCIEITNSCKSLVQQHGIRTYDGIFVNSYKLLKVLKQLWMQKRLTNSM